MNIRTLTPLAAALLLAFSPAASAQSMADVMKEMQALKARVGDLEKKLKEAEAKAAATPAAPAGAQWGMTPEQSAELNKVVVKVDAIEENNESSGFKGLKITGYIEPVFIYNHLQHRAGFQFLNSQADGYFYDTSYMGAAVVDFTKEMDDGTIWKLTLAPNRGTGALIDGVNIIQEASVSVPLGSLQTRLLAGHIPDWSGYEYQQPTLNPFTTHNLLYDFTLPTAYTGVGISHTEGKWWWRGVVGNVNATTRGPGEKSPSVSIRADYSKGEFDGFGGTLFVGKSPNYNTGFNTMAQTFELDAYSTMGDWTLQGQASIGRQDQGGITPNADGVFGDSSWWGASVLTGYAFSPRLQGLVRADYIRNTKNGGGLYTYNGYYNPEPDDGSDPTFNDDRNGIGPSPTGDLTRGANRYALSFKYSFNPSTTLKAEYRLDGADRNVFIDTDSGEYKKQNHLFGASMVVAF